MNGLQSSWQAWIFDLDDTLLDTSRELIPTAYHRVCEFMVKEGASPSMEVCLNTLSQWRHKLSGTELLQKLIVDEVLNEKVLSEKVLSEKNQIEKVLPSKSELALEAYRLFRTPVIPATLSLTPGSAELLPLASKQFPLFLVTQGDIPTQIKKVQALAISDYFRHIYYVDPFIGETKQQAFAEILKHFQLTPARVLSIGNRLDNEIAHSKREGMQTCYVRYGEHRFENPMTKEEIPDYEITHLTELNSLLSPKERVHE